MKILVTGGAGFIGRYLVKSLEKNTVKIYDNLSSSSKNDIIDSLDKVEFVNADVLDYDTLVSESKNFDCMIHLAAKSSVAESLKNPEQVNRVNIDGTINVLNACVENKIKNFLFASSAAIYGNVPVPISEDIKKNPLSPYGASKLYCEEKISEYAKKYMINCVSLRIFNVYGIGQNQNYAGVISKFAENIIHDSKLIIYGDGKQTRDFISIYDVVESFHRAIDVIDKLHGDAFNVATGVGTTVNELATLMMKISGKKLEIIYQNAKNADIKYSHADIEKAKKILGFEAKISLKEGLKEILSSVSQ